MGGTTRPDQPASRRPRVVALVMQNCTGCQACVDFCLVDCIDENPHPTPSAPPIQIRQDDCIGCQLCVKVCDHLALHAIRLVPLQDLSEARAAAVPLVEVA